MFTTKFYSFGTDETVAQIAGITIGPIDCSHQNKIDVVRRCKNVVSRMVSYER